MAQKTYITHQKSVAIAWPGKKTDLFFVGGKLVTSDKEEQDFIESLPSFKNETIYLESPADLIAAAEQKAKSLRAVANEAAKAALAAEAELAALSPEGKKAEQPKEEKPKKEDKAPKA